MTEHAAVIFVFFFLAEYASIVLICILISIFFLGGYLVIDTTFFYDILDYFDAAYLNISIDDYLFVKNRTTPKILSDINLEESFFNFSLAIKTCIMIFIFI